MSQPILSIKAATAPAQKTIPNLLPCRVSHSGSVAPIEPYWTPSQSEDGSRTAYFRGRKLHGKSVKLPDGYRGVVAEKGESPAAKPQQGPEVVDLEQEDVSETGSLEAKAEFDEVVVWGHEATADAGADPYVRGIEEWVGLAEQIHSYPSSK